MGNKKIEHQRKILANRIIQSELKKIGVTYSNGMNIERAAELLVGHHNLFSDGRTYTRIEVAEALSPTLNADAVAAATHRAGRKAKWSSAKILHSSGPTGDAEAKIKDFYASWEWKRLSFDVKVERGRKCECCGAKAPDVRIHTDHVKPIRYHWHMRLDRKNLQILCEDCNMGKGSRDETDFREPKAPPCLDIAAHPRDALDGQPPPESVIWN